MFDFTDPSGMEWTGRPAPPKASMSPSTSTTSPTFVDVPCPSTREQVAGSSPATAQPFFSAKRWPTGFGAVIPLPRPSLEAPMPRMTA